MAWFNTGKSNKTLIDNLKKNHFGNHPGLEYIYRQMVRVDRGNYVNNEASGIDNSAYAYEDSPQPIGHQQTISQPHMHQYSMDLLVSSNKQLINKVVNWAGQG